MNKIYRTYKIDPQAANTLILTPDIKNYLQIDVIGDDSMIERLANTAFDLILLEYDIVSVTSDITEEIHYSEREFTLKFKPVRDDSITVVKVGEDGGTEELNTKLIRGNYSTQVTIQDDNIPEHIRVSYSGGFGTDGTQIQDPLFNVVRQGVLQSVGTFYQDRENNVIGNMIEIPSSTRNMIENILNINLIN